MIAWVGHASFRIAGQKQVYLDPYSVKKGSPPSDVILITHAHEHHFSLQDIEKAWKPVHPVSVKLNRTEINPQFASIVTPTEVVVTVEFSVEIDSSPGKVYMCIPYPSIEPIKEKLQAGYQSDQDEVDSRWMDRFREQLLECSLNIKVELGHSVVTVRDILNLAVGDVIMLDQPAEKSIVAKVENLPKFLGRPGQYRGNLAFQIMSHLS